MKLSKTTTQIDTNCYYLINIRSIAKCK